MGTGLVGGVIGGSFATTLHTDTVAPTVNSDSGSGYAVGNQWFNTANGLFYICRDATVAAADWLPIGLQGAAVPVGADLLPSHFSTGTTSAAFGSNVYAFVPFTVCRRQAFSQLAWWQVTASGAGGLCRTALYTSTGGIPDQLIAGTDSGDIDVTTGAGVLKAGVFGGGTPAAVTIDPGIYWGMWQYNGTGGSLTVTRFSNSSGINMNFAVTASPTGGARQANVSHAYEAPQQTARTVTGSQADSAILMLRGA
jgi:hypothetical protein